MRSSRIPDKKSLLHTCLILAQALACVPAATQAQEAPKPAPTEQKDATAAAKPIPAPTDAGATNMVPGVPGVAGATNNEPIQVSFQGANIDMIVQWLAEKTGKSVVKHPQAQCQLTIVSSKKVSVREAIALIYRALALEGVQCHRIRNFDLHCARGQGAQDEP